MEPLVEMKGIRKSFLRTVANDGIDFTISGSEVVSLLGENGAGKTTLMRILYGMYSLDEGEIHVGGNRVEIGSPKDSIAHGIGMVHQHFTLVRTLSVLENVILGLPSPKGFRLDYASSRKRLLEISQRYGLEIDSEALIWQLSVGERQRVEILKALYRDVNVLILDEPTAVLTPKESEGLFETLRILRREGKGVVFISHKLQEVMGISDRIVVLRSGKVSGERRTSDTTKEELARLMVGREVLEIPVDLEGTAKGPLLSVSGLSVNNDQGVRALKGVSFTIHSREILGIAGVAGNGQRELEEILCGVRRPLSGSVRYKELELAGCSPKQIIEAGIGRIPEDRMESGLILDLPLVENLVIESFDRPPYSRGMLLNYRAMEVAAKQLVAEYDIRTASVYEAARTLSGGNLQKVILARVLSRKPEVVIASQPTRGLDVGAAEYIHNKLLGQRGKGAGILLLSEDLNEVIALSDRIIVLYEGRIMGSVTRRRFDLEQIGLMMAGSTQEDGHAAPEV
ncbi:MAG TPA: ABC transporter ATP-binding protein [Spirochaetia bacterium]|nr:ABC transporter ATP-binding protein [Spirochaetia bacterium]